MSSTFNLTGSLDLLQHGVHDELIEAVRAIRGWFEEEYLLREMMPYGISEERTYLLIQLLDPGTLNVIDNIHIDHSSSGLFIEDDRERDMKHMMASNS